ncbi:MAG: hypothetical protein EOM32_14700, partial [Spirochaetia bacterium]|nr:hypothetical protein [Spirochaetia bacterium]
DMQSGTGGSGSVNATYDAAMPGATAPTRTGYTFCGYYDQTNGGGTQYYTAAMASARSWNKTDNAPILYAKWTIDTYLVSYDANSASSGSVPAAQTKTYGSNLTLASNTGLLAKTGYTFAGWNTAANGSGTDYAAGATYSTNAALTLYAKWIATWVVGGLGPSGGYIFHDKGSYSDGWRYLEAAPSDIAVGAALFGYYRETSTGANLGTGATGTAIGTGKTNTANLVSKMGETAYISSSSTTTSADYAANLATKHIVENGGVEYKDWFLPSKDELYAMFVNLVKDREFPLGNFLYGTYNEYWSSSEDISYDPSGYAIAQTFSAVSTPGLPSSNAGDQYYYSRRISIRVRPVRAF